MVAGVVLIALGIREYQHGHSHSTHSNSGNHSHDQSHDHDHNSDNHHSPDQGHSHNYDDEGLISRLRGIIPFVGGHSHSHSHEELDDAADRGLLGIAWFAFLLGFAHEEEFEIIALCAGSNYCLELMSAYAITVIVGIVGLTMLLIAGYEHSEETVEYLPAFSATVLIIMGIGFILGVF